MKTLKKRRIAGGGPTSGPIGCDSDQFRRFADLLRERGFTPAQLAMINDAMKEAGLMFRSAWDVQR